MKIESEKGGAYYRWLSRIIVLLMVSMSVIPLLSLGGVTLYYYSGSLKANVMAYLEAIVNKHKIHIDTFLNEKLADIQILAHSFPTSQLLDDVFLQERLRELKDRYGDFVDLGIVDSNGYQRAYAGPFKLEDAKYADAHWFKRAMRQDFFVSDVFLGLRGLPHFIVAIKKQDPQGKIWIIRSTIDFEKFTSLVENIIIGRTGHAFILNKEGEFQTKQKFRSDGDFHLVNSSFYHATSEAGVSVIEKETEPGQWVIYAISLLKNGEWILVCQQHADDAYSSLYHVRSLVFFISCITFLSGLGISYLLARALVGRMELADQEREKMSEQVIEAGKLASIGELAAGIAHEVNNPVAIMVEEAGWIEDLLEDEDLSKAENIDEFKRALKQIKAQGTRCKQITHKLLSFARKTDSKLSALYLNELIEEVVGLSQRTARYSNVRIETELDRALPPLTASPAEIQQVLLNLINNAIDSIGKEGGQITIRTRMENGHTIIDVEDTGCGIPESQVQRIFDPFFSTKSVGKGTGLGLSICYGIVDRMGGRIGVKSAVGKGTNFCVRIPSHPKENEV